MFSIIILSYHFFYYFVDCLDNLYCGIIMEIIKMECLVCGKQTEHQVKEYKDGYDYKCTVCGKIYYKPKEIKKEYMP